MEIKLITAVEARVQNDFWYEHYISRKEFRDQIFLLNKKINKATREFSFGTEFIVEQEDYAAWSRYLIENGYTFKVLKFNSSEKNWEFLISWSKK